MNLTTNLDTYFYDYFYVHVRRIVQLKNIKSEFKICSLFARSIKMYIKTHLWKSYIKYFNNNFSYIKLRAAELVVYNSYTVYIKVKTISHTLNFFFYLWEHKTIAFFFLNVIVYCCCCCCLKRIKTFSFHDAFKSCLFLFQKNNK